VKLEIIKIENLNLKENIYNLKDINRKFDENSKEIRQLRRNEEELTKQLKKKDEMIG